MAQTAQYYPAHAISKEHIRHPGDLDSKPVITKSELMPDCDPRIVPPPRHPGRLTKTNETMAGVIKYPTPRIQNKEVAEIRAVECEAENDDQVRSLTDRPPTPHRRPKHPPRMRGSNSSLGNPRWSAFPSPPEGPPQPPPNRPLPQLPPTPAQSTRSRQSSGASKRSGSLTHEQLHSSPRSSSLNHQQAQSAPRSASLTHEQAYTSPRSGSLTQEHAHTNPRTGSLTHDAPQHISPHFGPNVFPPSPPTDLPANSPVRSTFGHPVLHDRSSSSHSSTTSSSNRTSSLAQFPSYSTSTLAYHPSFPITEGRMATLEERTFEEDPTIKKLGSISTSMSSHSNERHPSSSGRRMSSSTGSSEGGSKNKKSGLLGGKGLKALVKGRTPPLIEAVKSNDLKSLLDQLAPGLKPVDINCTDRDNWTPLHWAADLGHQEIAEVLLARNAVTEARTKSQGRTPLYLAAAHGHAPMANLLLENGAAVNSASKMDGATAIHKAAQHGYTEVITALVAGKADVNKRDVEGMPPLMWATQRKQLHAAHKLVAAGADLEIRIKLGANLENSTVEGLTVLHKVAGTGDVAFARLFLEHGADPDANAPAGFRALHKASSKGDLAMVEVLVEFGADVNLRSSEGWAPLHFAARHGHRKVCLFLVRQGADANMRTGKVGSGIKGDTAAELARKHGFEDVIG